MFMMLTMDVSVGCGNRFEARISASSTLLAFVTNLNQPLELFFCTTIEGTLPGRAGPNKLLT
jgi:hypothetical protein